MVDTDMVDMDMVDNVHWTWWLACVCGHISHRFQLLTFLLFQIFAAYFAF